MQKIIKLSLFIYLLFSMFNILWFLHMIFLQKNGHQKKSYSPSINKILRSNFRIIEPYFHVTSVLITLAGLPAINVLGFDKYSFTLYIGMIIETSGIRNHHQMLYVSSFYQNLKFSFHFLYFLK